MKLLKTNYDVGIVMTILYLHLPDT